MKAHLPVVWPAMHGCKIDVDAFVIGDEVLPLLGCPVATCAQIVFFNIEFKIIVCTKLSSVLLPDTLLMPVALQP